MCAHEGPALQGRHAGRSSTGSKPGALHRQVYCFHGEPGSSTWTMEANSALTWRGSRAPAAMMPAHSMSHAAWVTGAQEPVRGQACALLLRWQCVSVGEIVGVCVWVGVSAGMCAHACQLKNEPPTRVALTLVMHECGRKQPAPCCCAP